MDIHPSQNNPEVHAFFDRATNTASYVVVDPNTKACAVIDSVMDYEPNGAAISFESADRIIAFIREHSLTPKWVLETHAHADHLSAAPYIQRELGGKIGIGKEIVTVQNVFGKVFNAGTEFQRDGSQFDRLFEDGDEFTLGALAVKVIHTPGHTPADVTYLIGDAAFVGDTLFMQDYGTARCDFPGGSADDMYRSIQKLFTLPDETRVFVGHDYLPVGRTEYRWETTIGEEKRGNIQVREGVSSEEFAKKRNERDATLGMPRLIIPSIQVNIQAGKLPEPEANGTTYLKVPLNSFGKKA
ncbi:MBL fold metallo-hydrolase [Candidatus Kaiserbacteria bacterium]|nr:MBL fold metallo-hydrolase [Candidatus Kaiserbacteria bacterium]